MAEPVLVVGAGGSVGRTIVAALLETPGLVPIAGCRRPPAASAVETRLADTGDADGLEAALRGCALVVNAVGGPAGGLAPATSALCRVALRAGVRRLVHIGSAAVYGGEASGCVAESAPFAARPTRYQAAKIDSEQAVQAYREAGGGVVILRPGLVFGPASAQWAQRMARLLRARRLGDLGAAGDGWCNLTHEADLGHAVAKALTVPEAAGLAINLASAAPLTWNEFLEAFARGLGATPLRRIGARRLAVERMLAPALHAARMAGAPMPDPIPASLLALFAQRMRLDPTLADRCLGITRTQDADGIAATAAKLRPR